MSRIKEFFQILVKAGAIPQEPMNYDAATLKIYIDHLESENAALRERLEKAVELPCIEPMTTWDWDNETGIGESHFGDRYQLLYRDKDGEFIAYVGLDKEEAEARLAELKGGKE